MKLKFMTMCARQAKKKGFTIYNFQDLKREIVKNLHLLGQYLKDW
jgi:hypothetical protein